MKILTKEEEAAHYNETLKGGFVGGSAGLILGAAGIYVAGLRYPAFRQLPIPLRAFLATSSTTFGAIVTADHFSRGFERAQHASDGYRDSAARNRLASEAAKPGLERMKDWGREHRYKIVAGSWVASIIAALAITGRNKYLSTPQKLVQARVYAQSLTVAVMLAAAALEVGDQQSGKGRWETIQVADPDDPKHEHTIEKRVHKERYEGEDQWRDMVEAEQARLEAREKQVEQVREERHEKHHKTESHEKEHAGNKGHEGKHAKGHEADKKNASPKAK